MKKRGFEEETGKYITAIFNALKKNS